jgi:parallel beta-helix repeat protein
MSKRSVVLAVLLTVVGLFAPASDAAMQIGCGGLITTDTTLSRSIVNCVSPDILTITNSGVTLDLDGHTLDGASCTNGIRIEPGLSNVRIVGPGFVRQCNVGVNFDGVTGSSLSGVTVAHNTADGVVLTAAPNNVLRRNAISNNGDSGVEILTTSSGVKLIGNTISANFDGVQSSGEAHRLLIRKNVLQDNGSKGLDLGDDNTTADRTKILENVIRRNGSDGIEANGKIDAIGNLLAENGLLGIQLQSGESDVRDNIVRNNANVGIDVVGDSTVVGNTVTDNLFRGIQAQSNNVIRDNIVRANEGEGISGDEANTIVGNSVKQNGSVGIATFGNSNVVRRNIVVRNDGDGINISGATAGTVAGNTANKNGFDEGAAGNDNFGITAPDVAGIVGKNAASGNDVADPAIQCFPARLC